MTTSMMPLPCRPTHEPELVRRVPRLFADWNRVDNTQPHNMQPHLPAASPLPIKGSAPKALPASTHQADGATP